MERTTLIAFLEKKNAKRSLDAFYFWLMGKYPQGIPSNVNLEDEWAEFYREGTSKTVPI